MIYKIVANRGCNSSFMSITFHYLFSTKALVFIIIFKTISTFMIEVLGKPILGWYHYEHHTLIFLNSSNFEKS
jgi:hypothetical protein